MGFVIGSHCIDVKDKSCIEECPVDCIYEGERMLYIHPAECIDCGACEPVCPVEAIRPMQRLADEWKPFKDQATELFANAGRHGGAGRPDLLADPQFVKDFVKAD